MEKQVFLKNIREYNGIIIKIVNMYADDPEDRKDLYQEIIYQSWKASAGFRMEAKFSTWLYKISLNVSLTFLHKKKKHTKVTEAITIDEYEPPIELSENADRLYTAIKALNEIERGLIMLHLDGYDNDAISDIMGISKNNTGVRLHRIKQKLTDILTKKNMDLQQEWNNMNSELSNQNQSFAPDKIEIQKSSKNAYMNLLMMFRAKMNWITALSLPMLVGAIFAVGLLKYLLLAMFVCYQLLRIVMNRKISQLPNHIDYTSVTKDFITVQLTSIRTLLRQEKIWSYLFGPLSAPFGYMCLKAYQYKTFDQIVANEPKMLYIMIGLALFVFPINYFAGKATKKAFGNDIDKLAAHLKVLEGN